MTPHSPTPTDSPAAEPQRIDDLFKLTLPDGLKVQSGGRELRYRVVTLRETGVADERRAEALSERAVLAGGAWKLLVSESNFKHVLNMLHLESFHCDGDVIPQAMIDLAMYDKLSSADLELLEERIFLITLASEVRYGNMSQAEFETIVAGLATPKGAQPPQPTGQSAAVGAFAERAGSGPALLADFTGVDAQGAADGDGRAVQ